MVPQICDQQLGKGINYLQMQHNITLIGNSEVGFYTDTQSEVFSLWKNKLHRHEEKVLQNATTLFRNERRAEKVRLEKLKQAQDQQKAVGGGGPGVLGKDKLPQ